MTTLLDPRVHPTTQAAPSRAGWRLISVLVGTASAALAVLMAREGSALWRVGRPVAVLTAGVIAVLILRHAPRHRVMVPLLAGVPAFVAGAGIGVPHAAAGVSVAAVAGLAALVSGIALLGVALIVLWRRTAGWGRAGVLVAVFAVAQWVLIPASVAVFATNRVPTPLPARTPADVGLAYREVTLPTADGLALRAWYVPSRNGAAVVVLHGSGSTRANVLDHARVLADRGYGTLLLDARGHGESTGHAMDFGWYGDADIAPAVAFLARSPDVTGGRIGVLGMSMGGEEAIGAAASVPGIRAVVAEGVTGRTGSDWLPLRPAGVGRWFSTIFYGVQDAITQVLSGTPPPLDLRSAVVAAEPRPVFVVAAGEVDQEGIAGRRLQAAAVDRVDLWEVPGAGHTGGLATRPDEWARRVGAFLDTALLD